MKFVSLLLLSTLSLLFGQSGPHSFLDGTWVITRLLDTSKISIDLEHAKALTGREFAVQGGRFVFDGRPSQITSEAHAISRSQIVEDYRIDNLKALHLPKRVQEVEADCCGILIQDRNHFALNYAGLFVQVVRANR